MPETRTIWKQGPAPASQSRWARMAATMGVGLDDLARSATTNVVRRPVRVEETAASVAWLTSDSAAGIAGQVITLCGGAIVSR